MAQKVSFAKESAAPVLIVGSVAYDNIETPYATGERILGGSASYAGLAASYYAPVRMVGVIGNDFAASDIDRLKARDIDVEGIETDDTGPTFFWRGKYYENFNKRDTLELQLNVFASFQPKIPESYKDSPFLMLGNIHPQLQAEVLAAARGKPFTIADTIDFWIETEKEALLQLIKNIDLFIINDDEATLLTGEPDYISAGRKLIQIGPKIAIVKKGSHGAYLFHPEGMFAIPAYPVTDLRDPTGAGDSFAGALLGYLAAKNDTSFAAIKKAMLYATVTASLTVEAFSCDRLESAGSKAIEERHAELLKLISL